MSKEHEERFIPLDNKELALEKRPFIVRLVKSYKQLLYEYGLLENDFEFKVDLKVKSIIEAENKRLNKGNRNLTDCSIKELIQNNKDLKHEIEMYKIRLSIMRKLLNRFMDVSNLKSFLSSASYKQLADYVIMLRQENKIIFKYNKNNED